MRRESGEPEAQEPRGLAMQSVELRRQLQEEQASYRRKLQAYQEGQQRQAQLVQRLQAKVGPPPCSLHPSSPPTPTAAANPLSGHPQILQCKKKTSETEQQLLERCAELEQLRLRVGTGVWGGSGLALPALPSLTPPLPHPPGRRAQPGPGERPRPPGGGATEVGPRGARGGRRPSAQAPTGSPLPRSGAPAWPR